MPNLQLIIFPSPSYPFPSPLISLSLSLSLNKNKRQSKRQQDVEQREEVEKEQVKCNGFFPVVHPHLSKSLSFKPRFSSITCSSLPQQPRGGEDSVASSLKTFSTAVALSSILLSSAAAPPPAVADIAGLTPCKESKAFAKREKQSIKKLETSLKKYAPGSAPALAINATIEKTKRRFDNYGKFGLLCGSDGLPHLIVSGDQRHWGEFITPGFLFLYIAGWIGWVGRSYLIAIRDDKKPTMKEIIIDVPLASRLLWRGFIWPVAAYRELVNGDLIAKDV